VRVLQVGFGTIGREIFTDYSAAFAFDTYMVVDLVAPIPEGYGWDGGTVDVAVIVVDTPSAAGGDGFDYRALTHAIEEYSNLARFILIRSTVSLGFLTEPAYLKHAGRIGFAPEFYGATKWSSRDALTIDFTVFTHNVPNWFRDQASPDVSQVVAGTPSEVIVAKLTENAYLATKVTFFHELSETCRRFGIDFENVRNIATSDPRINSDHSFMEQLGWQSHCFDKDVPAFSALGQRGSVVERAIESNKLLLKRRTITETESNRLD
jgi:UDP-glucose 6-dehydrogenase